MDKASKTPTVSDATYQQVGEVYARALLGIGQATGKTDELMEELIAFDGALAKLPKLATVLQAPRVPVAEKQKLVDKILTGRCSKDFLHFIQVLTRKGRLAYLSAVRRAAGEMHDELVGNARALVTTATPISDQSRDRLVSRLGNVLGKKMFVTTTVDESIIGGVVVRVGDTVYDASVANQLQQLKTKTTKRVADSIRASLDRFATDV
jgi:F-type H+-transporting ATPase subunit delta